MFSFSREGKQVKVAIDVDVPNYARRSFWLYWNCNSEEFAGLLVDLFRQHFLKYRNASRNAAYEAGWNDAKAKRAKGVSKYW